MTQRPTYDPTYWPWVRTCQACGAQIAQAEPSETTKASAAYALRACRSCGSEAFDYGSKQPWSEAQKAELQAFVDWEAAND